MAMTFDIKPGSTACSGPVLICSAEAFVAVDVGSRHWSDGGIRSGGSVLVAPQFVSLTQVTGLNLVGIVNPEPAGAGSLLVTGLLSIYPTLYPAGSTLPPTPPPTNPTYLLRATEGGATATAPYTGNVCARSSALPTAPSINTGGVVALYTSSSFIQPGSWISIFGKNLATATAVWNGDFPTSLGGTTVSVNRKPAYLWFVSPEQINLQVPDDAASGFVDVVVTTPNGSVTSTAALGPYSPSFSLLDGRHATAIILRSNGSGAYGGGSYDIVGPTGTSLGYKTVAARPGDSIALFGLGFGATTPVVAAGKPFSGAAAANNPIFLQINNTLIRTTFAGLVSPGLYQFNFVVPSNLGGSGDLPLTGTIDRTQTPAGVVFSVE